MTDDLLDIEGIAALLRRTPKTVRDRLVHQPQFPPPALVSGPRSRLWLKADVIAWATPAARKSPQPSPGSRPTAEGSGHDAR